MPTVKKGKQIAITGELKQERWRGQDGTNHSRVVIAAQQIQLLGRKDSEGGQENPQQAQQSHYDDLDTVPF